MPKPPTLDSAMRVRRHEPTRLEGFVDAAFAFAVTLVVISFGHMPQSVSEMLQALRGLPTFAACFALIARIWLSHRNWSRHYDIDDTTTTVLSLILVFFVLVYVYPLRLLFALMFASVSNGWLVDQPVDLHSYFELRAAFVVFGLGYAAIWIVLALLYRHALKLRTTIGLDDAEVLATRLRLALTCWFCAIAFLSIALALFLPFEDRPWTTSMPGAIYLLIIPIARLLKRGYGRRFAELAPGAVAS
ncbi:MAG TPA: TMEM175 family protein [Rudaea sp.]|uniref:TMEM175 family protein n=1 Tax=Rudaea sp. TaxID=2136325 RepID=UPI002F92AB70